jgi:chromosome segregation ATPase
MCFGGREMSKYKLVNDDRYGSWINKPNNMGDVGDLNDITDEMNRLLSERDEANEELSKKYVEYDQLFDAAEKIKIERDEAREENTNLKLQLGLWEDGNLICEETLGEIRLLEERIEEAQKKLSSIHRWINKNHADGFIDSLTYLQNLERVTDSWYDRIDGIEADARRFVRERDEAREALKYIAHSGLSARHIENYAKDFLSKK